MPLHLELHPGESRVVELSVSRSVAVIGTPPSWHRPRPPGAAPVPDPSPTTWKRDTNPRCIRP
eukprot:2732833-Prymnesium_polylepis.2